MTLDEILGLNIVEIINSKDSRRPAQSRDISPAEEVRRRHQFWRNLLWPLISGIFIFMALKKAGKSKIVDELASQFRKQKIAIFSVFHGISVAKATALRRLLKKGDAELKIAKKTLLDRALNTAGIEMKTKELAGEISVTFGYGDEATPAKTLSKFSRENETFKIVAGILGNRILTGKEVLALAKLPNREVLLAQLARTLQSPMQGFATVLAGNIRNLVVVLNKIKDNK